MFWINKNEDWKREKWQKILQRWFDWLIDWRREIDVVCIKVANSMSIEDEGGNDGGCTDCGERKCGTWFAQCQQYAINIKTIDNGYKRKRERKRENLDRFSHCT